MTSSSTTADTEKDADVICIEHPSGSRVKVHRFGATITSFETCSGREVLFLSSLAKLDGSKPIRGGIPLVFPQFGQPDKSMPQHGFLRNRRWSLGKVYQDPHDSSSCCELHISFPQEDDQQTHKFACQVTLLVKLQPTSLTTVLSIVNTQEQQDFDFQALFHTYYRVEGGNATQKQVCNVQGLSGYRVYDQITKENYILQDGATIHIDREVDRIITPTNTSSSSASTASPLKLILQTGYETTIEASASIDGVHVPVSVVVWNPFIEKSKGMIDFDNQEYHDMICVEPGILTNVPSLKSGQKATFQQVISTV